MHVSVVVPTYREAENLPHLVDRLAAVARDAKLGLDLAIVDDDSRDGTAELVRARPEDWVRLVLRTSDRGLSQAVLEGLRQAKGDVLVCMDADLSHPPEAIPRMLEKLAEGADFVIGSRYTDGGSTADDWGFLRWVNSRVATWLARPLTHVSDPMSGYFALRRSTFEAGSAMNPLGYKIGLELVVKCRCERVVEVPIHFADRRFGESKLTIAQQLLYLRHLWRLYTFKFGLWTPLVRFVVIGVIGTLVNLLLLTALVAGGIAPMGAVAFSIFGAMAANFVLSRRWDEAARAQPLAGQLLSYVGATMPGALVNYAATLLTAARAPGWPLQAAALVGIAAGAVFNLAASRYLAFRARHVRAGRGPGGSGLEFFRPRRLDVKIQDLTPFVHPEAVAEEQRRADRLRRTVDVACAWLRQTRPPREEGEALVAFVRDRAMELFPGREDVFSIVLAPRFARILDEFCRSR